MKITLLELTVLVVTLVDSLDITADSKTFAFGRAARNTVWKNLILKLKNNDVNLALK